MSWKQRQMPLRWHLYALALGAALPVALFTALAGYFVVQYERETLRQEAIGRVRAAMTAVDAEIQGHILTIQAVAAATSLRTGDLRRFHEDCRAVLATQPDWYNIALQSGDGKQLFDAILPYESSSRSTSDEGSLHRAIATKRPAIGNVVPGAITGVPTARVRVPVIEEGRVRYVISVALKLEIFERLLRQQRVPSDWFIGLADADKKFIGRIPPRPPGSPISETLRVAFERSPEGFVYGETAEGIPTYAPYVTSDQSGWVLAIAVPTAAVRAAAGRASVILTAALLASLVIAMWFAWLIARRIERPISGLADAALTLKEGGQVSLPSTRITQMSALAAVLHDASLAVREREALLKREKAVLEEADRAKDEFIAMLSHELRNPLAAIAASAEVLKGAPSEGEAARQARGVIERQTNQMAHMLEDLLDVSRVALGKIALKMRPVNLAALAFEVVETMQDAGRLGQHHLALGIHPVWIEGDPERMKQVLTNLLDNAIKYTPPGKRIELSVHRAAELAWLTVRDEGAGIEAQDLERIFGPLVQGPQQPDRKRGGLGLGLAIVKRLIELHGGTVAAQSEGAGRGATFVVRLPAIPAPLEQAEPDRNREFPPRRVLLVDDDDDLRPMMSSVLALMGHTVYEARDGQEALSLAKEVGPEVVLIDIGLPDIDGHEVARRLRMQSGEHIALVAMSGYGQPEDRRRAEEAGFDTYLVKPVSSDALAAALR
jgi:signal transduction histidine kinase/CheY-like chemotaxis protein